MYSINFKNKIMHYSASYARILPKGKVNDSAFAGPHVICGICCATGGVSHTRETVDRSDADYILTKKARTILVAEADRINRSVRSSAARRCGFILVDQAAGSCGGWSGYGERCVSVRSRNDTVGSKLG